MKLSLKSIGLMVTAVIIALSLFLSKDQLTLENAQAALSDLTMLYNQNPILFIGAYTLIYAVLVLFYLPGPFFLNLIAGAVLGVYLGVAVAVISVTVGSLMAFLASRYLLYDWVKKQFPRQAKSVNRAVQKSGATYVLMLRLAPALPVGLTNLLAGITAVKLRVFVVTTLIGVVPWIAFYVVTGQQLASLQSLDNLISTNMLVMIGALMALIGFGHLAMKRIEMSQA